MALQWSGILDREIGKDITNFVTGYYPVDENGLQYANNGTLTTLPDGIWEDVYTLFRTQENAQGVLEGSTYYVIAPTTSLLWTSKIPTYTINVDKSLTPKKNWSTIYSSQIKQYSESEISQWFSNENVREKLKILGMKYYEDFMRWAVNMKVSIPSSFQTQNSTNWAFDYFATKSYYIKYSQILQMQNLTLPTNDNYLFGMYYIWYTVVLGEKPSDIGDLDSSDVKFITEWTLFVDGIDSGNPIFSWEWASASFEHFNNYINTDESKILIEFGTVYNYDNSFSNPPKYIEISWDSQPYTITLEDLWALTNSKPSTFDDLQASATKRKICFTMYSQCGEYKSDGIYVQLWESGKLNGEYLGENTEGYLLFGEDTFRYLEGQPPNDNGNDEENGGENDGSDGDENAGNPTASAQLGTTYTMNSNTFRAIRQWLWSADFFDNIMLINNNPVENIVSAKVFPFEQDGIPTSIMLGNVDSNYTGQLQKSTVKKFSDIAIDVPNYYNNYLDYSPYTDVKIHLPFIGIKPLDTSVVMGKTINVRYLVDLVLGQCQCDILLNGRVINSYVGMIGIDLPISGQNRSEVEIGYITSALTTTFSALAREPIGAVIGISNGISNKFRTETTGQYNPNMQMYSDYDIYLIIERPTLTIPTNYGSTEGYPLNRSGQIKSYSGYTICDNVDTSSIKALSEERAEIKSIMENGFYI